MTNKRNAYPIVLLAGILLLSGGIAACTLFVREDSHVAGAGARLPAGEGGKETSTWVEDTGTTTVETVLEVPYISQEGVLPTGCEIVSAAMLLRYYGVSTPVETLARSLPRQEIVSRQGFLSGPDPREAFAGDPFSAKGYGCYSPVIAELLERELAGSGRNASVMDGVSLTRLVKEQVAKGRPALIWATIGMKPSKEGASWRLANGETFTWRSREHCLLLVGADADSYYFNDPYQGRGLVRYERELVQRRYEEMGMQAVIVE